MKHIRIIVEMDAEVVTRLDAAARALGLSRSAYIRQLIMLALRQADLVA